LKLDKCGVCDGDGSKCKTIEGSFDERNLSPGYHDVMRIPPMKNSSTNYFLNGNSMIQVERDVELNGVHFEYDDGKPEKITAKGPLEECPLIFRKTREVVVSVLIRKGNRDVSVKYEFSVPIVDEVDYMYKPGEWSACSVTCGKGQQTRTPYCIETKTQARVDDQLCDDANSTKPEFEKPCETVDCEAEWFEGEWEPCSQTCGDKGEQYRVVYCHQIFANGRRITVEDGNCTSERPAVRQVCNRFACPEWQAGPWSACSEKCGDAFQYRSVTCRSEKEGEEGKLLPADACSSENTLESQRSCNLGPCTGLKFFTTDWKLCSKCNDTEETREVTCKDTQGRAYPLEKCLTDDEKEIPPDTRWSTKHCVKVKSLKGKTNCTNEEKCTGTWYSSPWSPCSVECGGGTQERVAVCLNYDKKPVPEWCDEAEMPTLNQECNTDECPSCFDSEFGCCPDNSTFATGDFNQGCSNCSLSEFGCCADNYTEATGKGGRGCEEFVESPLNLEEAGEGSGEEVSHVQKSSVITMRLRWAETSLHASMVADSIFLTQMFAVKSGECQVKSENGETATVDCAAANATTTDFDGLFGNGTDGNGTMHCSKSEFGCCPDWFTPAEGPNNAGCPEFVLGPHSLANCLNMDVAQMVKRAALGANGTGCGENCLTTKYGCCPDGKGTAKGHHNEGCGCVYAQYGCCPDGKTSAKGAGFYGCPDSCAQSQFGCCPDGRRAAERPIKGCPVQTLIWMLPDPSKHSLGPRNDGCDDCRYAKYGCCPDGESKAIGPDYAGCPSTTLAPFLLGGTVAPSKISSCALPQDQGTVCSSGYKLVWYYDTAEGRCSQFWYGGCDGNDNRFATKEQCETICVEPPGIGEPFLQWFPLIGCLTKNAGRAYTTFCKDVGPFATTAAPAPQPPQPPQMPQVVAHPIPDERPTPGQRYDDRPRQPMQTMEEVCRSTQDSGPCQDYSDQFYYDAYKGTCETFIYGGCGGNLNRFRTEEECMQRCGFLNPTASPPHRGHEDPSHRAQPQQPESDSPQQPQPTYPDQRQQGPVRPPPPVVPQQP
ncbi:Kunitz/Bovine pancreatic trypsin inhibitor domain protein, partial [Ostertagia ostertagi]